MRAAAAMAHAAVLHVLDIFRNYRHRLDPEWSQGSLRGANTFPLEGLHSEARTGSVSKATDQNWTVAGWATLASKLQQVRDQRLSVAFHGWKTRAARNVQRTDKILTLQDVPGWWRLPTSCAYSLSCGNGGYLPPDSYDSFLADVTEAKHCGMDIALEIVEQFVPKTARQLRDKGLWPGKWLVPTTPQPPPPPPPSPMPPQRTTPQPMPTPPPQPQHPPPLPTTPPAKPPPPLASEVPLWRRGTERRDAAVKLVTGDEPVSFSRPAGPDGLHLDSASKGKLAKIDAKAAAEHANHGARHTTTMGGDVERDFQHGPGEDVELGLSIADMARHAIASQEELATQASWLAPNTL